MAKRDNLLIFLVDDDPMLLKMLEDHLNENIEADIRTFSTGEQCLSSVALQPDVVVLDYQFDSVDKTARNGLEILKDIKDLSPNTDVVMLSGQDKLSVATDTMKYGAYDYVVKNESAFVRTENLIMNIGNTQHLAKVAKTNKMWATILLVAFVAIVLISCIIFFIFPDAIYQGEM